MRSRPTSPGLISENYIIPFKAKVYAKIPICSLRESLSSSGTFCCFQYFRTSHNRAVIILNNYVLLHLQETSGLACSAECLIGLGLVFLVLKQAQFHNVGCLPSLDIGIRITHRVARYHTNVIEDS